MPHFNDFKVHEPLPAKTSWSALAPLTTHSFPPPVATAIPCQSPDALVAQPVSMTPAELTFRMSAVGYGAHAHYGLMWLLAGKPLGASELQDLRRLTKARLSIVHRAYKIVIVPPAGGLPTVQLVPRTIYPLIESSELVSTSFVMGCAMAEVCAPLALSHRPIGIAGVKLWHLFHVSLLEAAQLCSNVIKVRMTTKQKVDFLAIDSTFGTVHLVEAKGTGGKFDGSRVGDGLLQCAAVLGIEVLGGPLEPVASLNVCASYEHAGSVRTSVFELVPPDVGPMPKPVPPTPVAARTPVMQALEILFGTKLLGTYLMLRAAAQKPEAGNWLTFVIEPRLDDEEVVGLSAAISKQLWRDVDQFWSDAQLAMTAGPESHALRQELEGGPPFSEQDVRKDDLESLLGGLGRLALWNKPWENIGTPPQGFKLSAHEPWLAFEAVVETA